MKLRRQCCVDEDTKVPGGLGRRLMTILPELSGRIPSPRKGLTQKNKPRTKELMPEITRLTTKKPNKKKKNNFTDKRKSIAGNNKLVYIQHYLSNIGHINNSFILCAAGVDVMVGFI